MSGPDLLMQYLSGKGIDDDRIVHAVDRATHEIVEMRLPAWTLSALSVSARLGILCRGGCQSIFRSIARNKAVLAGSSSELGCSLLMAWMAREAFWGGSLWVSLFRPGHMLVLFRRCRAMFLISFIFMCVFRLFVVLVPFFLFVSGTRHLLAVAEVDLVECDARLVLTERISYDAADFCLREQAQAHLVGFYGIEL